MLGNFDWARTLATELPTVPKPSSAIFNVPLLMLRVVFFVEARFPAVAFFWAMAMLVVDSFCALAPGLEAGDGLVGKQLESGDAAGFDRLFYFGIEEGIVEADLCGIGGGVAVEDGRATRPIEGGEAHRARFAAGVDGAAGKLEATQRLAGGADGHDLGVCGGVVVKGDAIDAGGDDDAVADDHGAEGTAGTTGNVLGRERDGLFHEGGVAISKGRIFLWLLRRHVGLPYRPFRRAVVAG